MSDSAETVRLMSSDGLLPHSLFSPLLFCSPTVSGTLSAIADHDFSLYPKAAVPSGVTKGHQLVASGQAPVTMSVE
jgi:hypothetical protein